MKKINSTSSTSIMEIRLISGSSRWRGRRFISAGRHQRAALVQSIDELHRFLFHAYHEAFDLAAQEAVGDQRGYGDGQSGRRRDERLTDAAGEDTRIPYPIGGDGVEGMNDARDGSEQAKQRRDRRNRAQSVQEPLQLVHHVPAAVLEPLHHQRARPVAVGEADGEQLAQRRVLLQGGHQLVAELVGFYPVPHLLRQVTRYDAAALQGPEPFQYDGHRSDGTDRK